jgi:hypothetical protein
MIIDVNEPFTPDHKIFLKEQYAMDDKREAPIMRKEMKKRFPRPWQWLMVEQIAGWISTTTSAIKKYAAKELAATEAAATAARGAAVAAVAAAAVAAAAVAAAPVAVAPAARNDDEEEL